MSLGVQLASVALVACGGFAMVIQSRRASRSRAAIVVWTFIGGAIFTLATFLLGNVFHIFGEFTLARWMIVWVGLGGAGIFSAFTFLRRMGSGRRWWNYVTAFFMVLFSLLMGALGVNREIGYFVDINQALAMATKTNLPEIPTLDTSRARSVDLTTWQGTADQPESGMLVQATVPGTASGFRARPAIVYLPPAALVADPARLPLLVAIGGQPGSPQDVFSSGDLQRILEDYQKAHNGVAPIVVAPDLLGSPQNNPMCLDSDLGNTKTYMMTDVMGWIHENLPVLAGSANTALMGFSFGGTCVLQFGFEFPELADTIVPISAQLEPTIGSKTVERAFHGDEDAYRAITPLELLKSHGPYSHLSAAFYVGEDDEKYTAYSRTLEEAARHQGVQTSLTLSPHTGHNWKTAKFAISDSFPFIITQLGLAS
ncbi:hypothetical protein I6E29_03665 [Arcanobacterium haemolyticum]|nr:hypothetical protein [Arcanobacterium haemolyticum]